jgi:hypothetical protein
VKELADRLGGAFLARPGTLETPATVKRRLLLVALITALAIGGAYRVTGPADESWTAAELRDLAGLPNPPAPFAPTRGGDIRPLSPEEYEQLREIRALIERFPVPDQFVNVRPPATGGGGGG